MTVAMTPQGAVAVGFGAKLNGDATLLALATGGIWGGVAPIEYNLPYCYFQLQGGSGPEFTFAQEAIDDLMFIVKGIDDVDGVTADAIAARARVLLTDPALALGTGWSLKMCRPEGAPFNMQEPNGGSVFYHVGVKFRVKIFPA